MSRSSVLRLTGLWAAILLLVAPAPSVANDWDNPGGRFHGLDPGQFIVREQVVPVRLVFIGYQRSQIDEAALRSWLPKTYVPRVRYPQFYGLSGRDVGLKFSFSYRFVYQNRHFNDAFFEFLAHKGTPGDPTAFQQLYNDQAKNLLDVTGPVLYIDAPSVEKFLAGGDSDDQPGYTIYFVNWYGRPDFRFHVYTKTDEPDPDTDYNFGAIRGSRKMIAWGGTSSRSWFYDLSAGPESWTNNWEVDDVDVPASEYRLPPIWEYSPSGYGAAHNLGEDLGLVARFVGIDLLFTTSPLYDPLVTSPDVGGAKIAHVSMLEDDSTSSGLDFLNKDFALGKWRSFQPYYPWRVNVGDHDPIEADAEQALRTWADFFPVATPGCWTTFGDPFAELFCFFDANRDSYIPHYQPRNYVGGVFAFNTTAARLDDQFGLLGYADDNWVDGTQSLVFTFDSPEYRTLGYGFTTTVIHEFGHHIGMSHPHDGYDSEFELDYGPGGFLQFAWSGDESHTIMSYIDVTAGFGRFDRDNMHRWETAGYLNWANAVLGDIVASHKSHKVSDLLERADEKAARAIHDFNKWDYLESAAGAREAYEQVATAARKLGIPTPTLTAALRRLPNAATVKEGCRMRFPNS